MGTEEDPVEREIERISIGEFWDGVLGGVENRVILKEALFGALLYEFFCIGFRGVALICSDFDMGGCFPCFGSSNEEESGVKEVTKKDSVKEGSAAQSNHVTRVSSGFLKLRLLYVYVFFF